MVIIISYNKQKWNEYNNSQTADKNLANGAIISADKLNHMETGISNNDINKVTDNKDGTIEVNGSSITPADDSKVLHSTITQLNSTDMNSLLQAGYFNIINGKNVFPKGDNYTIYKVIPLSNTNGVQIAFENAVAILGMRAWNLNPGHLSFTDWTTFADDSKVVHNSGNEEIGGQKTYDIAPIDKKTGNPYITKDSVPSITKDGVPSILSDVARTGQPNTFTAAQTFSIAPTIKDASTDKGDNQAATMADLKSVEKSAWRELDLSGTSGVYKGEMNIKIDDTNKTIYLEGAMYFPSGTDAPQGTALIDLSHVVNHITSAHGCLFFLTGVNENANLAGSWGYSASTLGFSNSGITINSNVDYAYGKANYILPYPNPGKSAIYVTYDSLK